MDDATIQIDRDGGVAVLTMNRPETGNALSSELIADLRAGLAELDADPEVAAIVLTGAGHIFCAGLDLHELGDGNDLLDVSHDLPPSSPWVPLNTPLVGAVNGAAVTGGLEIALHCDVLLASTAARFADTHARVGVLPGWGLSVLLPLAVGRGLARRMSLTGEFLSADNALHAGLVTEVVSPSDLLDRARDVARAIAEVDPEVVQELLRGYRQVEGALVGDGPRIETDGARRWAANFDPQGVASRRESVVARNRAMAGGAVIDPAT